MITGVLALIKRYKCCIEPGDTGYTISIKLEESDVIKAAKVFYKIALNDGRAKAIAPGVHEIDREISSQSALEQLLDSKRILGVFGFPEGLRKSEIFELLAKSQSVTGKFSNKIYPNPIYKTKQIEGFLFPAQYSFLPGTTI